MMTPPPTPPSDEAKDGHVVCIFKNSVIVLGGSAVMCVNCKEFGAKAATLHGSRIHCERCKDIVPLVQETKLFWRMHESFVAFTITITLCTSQFNADLTFSMSTIRKLFSQ